MEFESFLSTAPLRKLRRAGLAYAALCPAHDDHNASLSVAEGHDGRILLHCWAGCETADVVRALGLTLVGPLPGTSTDVSAAPKNSPWLGSPVMTETAKHPAAGLTLDGLCAAKKLPTELLQELGCRDYQRNGRTVVSIPYVDNEGRTVAVRYRKALDGESRFEWRRGDKVQLYGLARLFAARGLGWVLIVEGESDAWTAWHYGIPCVGIPGKAQWKGERGRAWARLLEGVQAYIWQEPDAEIFGESISRDIPDAKIIVAPDAFKDISAAHLAGVDVAQLIEQAEHHGSAGAPHSA